MTIKKENLITREISEALSNKRLDVVLAETFPEYSRSRLKKMARKQSSIYKSKSN